MSVWNCFIGVIHYKTFNGAVFTAETTYEGWNFNSDNYLFTTDTK